MSATLLALDLSTAVGSLAVVSGGDLLYEASFESQRSHNACLFAPLGEALKAAGDDLDGVVVGIGPGSYTGVRIAIAAAQGIGLSRGVWCAGWSSLTAPDMVPPAAYRVIGDARRQSFYLASVESGRLLPEIEIVNAEAAHQRCSTDCPWITFDEQVPLQLQHVLAARPRAAGLAKMVAALPAEEFNELIARPLTPHYLAEAFITRPKGQPQIS
jgi:tRNA threonylcarbamoyladenosine biosynthesis protein TsaB